MSRPHADVLLQGWRRGMAYTYRTHSFATPTPSPLTAPPGCGTPRRCDPKINIRARNINI
eukprot:5368855-Pyramimonas_sp.AAC.1